MTVGVTYVHKENSRLDFIYNNEKNIKTIILRKCHYREQFVTGVVIT